MLNKSGVTKTTLTAPKQILANVELQSSVGCIVPQTLGVEVAGSKIAKAGTPIHINLTNLQTGCEARSGLRHECRSAPRRRCYQGQCQRYCSGVWFHQRQPRRHRRCLCYHYGSGCCRCFRPADLPQGVRQNSVQGGN